MALVKLTELSLTFDITDDDGRTRQLTATVSGEHGEEAQIVVNGRMDLIGEFVHEMAQHAALDCGFTELVEGKQIVSPPIPRIPDVSTEGFDVAYLESLRLQGEALVLIRGHDVVRWQSANDGFSGQCPRCLKTATVQPADGPRASEIRGGAVFEDCVAA